MLLVVATMIFMSHILYMVYFGLLNIYSKNFAKLVGLTRRYCRSVNFAKDITTIHA